MCCDDNLGILPGGVERRLEKKRKKKKKVNRKKTKYTKEASRDFILPRKREGRWGSRGGEGGR